MIFFLVEVAFKHFKLTIRCTQVDITRMTSTIKFIEMEVVHWQEMQELGFELLVSHIRASPRASVSGFIS